MFASFLALLRLDRENFLHYKGIRQIKSSILYPEILLACFLPLDYM